MEIITFESKAYKELDNKITAIADYIFNHVEKAKQSEEDMWVDSYEVCTFLKISEKTLQRLRVHIPADTRSAFPVISVQSPVSIQCCWQS